MNAYLFSAGVSQTQLREAPGGRGGMHLGNWDTCLTAIVCGEGVERAQLKFVTWCHQSPPDQQPVETEIKRIVAVQLIDQMLTESTPRPLDVNDVAERFFEGLAWTSSDPMEQGHWVDINHDAPPGIAALSMDALKRDLPEDIASGLNWSAERQFLYLVTAFNPPQPFPELPVEEPFQEDESATDASDAPEESATTRPELDPSVAGLPELREKEAAALVEARNSIVAAWVWHKFAAGAGLTGKEIHIGPMCMVFE